MIEKPASFFSSSKDFLVIVGLGLLVAVIYFQTTGFGFINLDDNLYVYDNGVVRSGLSWQSITWAFTSFWSANWHPLTWLSHMTDVQFFGLNAGMHHGMSVVIHLVNTLLAFVVLRMMTGRYLESLIVAALFSVHPTHVESVAWVSERKDVLSTLFWLLTMWAYVRYVRSKTSDDGTSIESLLSTPYLLVVLFFALGLLAKPMLVTLPFVLLLCDYWPLERFRTRRDILPRIVEKLPLFALSAASCVVTVIAQRSVGAVESWDYLPPFMRLANALTSYAKYIVMLVHPADLAVFYPYNRFISPWEVGGSIILLLGISAICIWQIRRRPFLIVGWLWFLGTLVPVIGFLQVGSQSLADRYTYVPYFGLFIMLVWGGFSLVGESGFGRRTVAIASAAVILIFAGLAIHQVSYWRDPERLYRHTLAVTSNNFLIAHNLCHHYMTVDRLDEAVPLCKQAIDTRPTYNEPYNTLGIVEFKRGNFAEAERQFKESLKYEPSYSYALLNLSQAQASEGKPEAAEETLRQAVEQNGGSASDAFAPALSSVAAAYAERQDYKKAVENFSRLIYIQPNNAEARTRLSLALYYLKRYDDAETQARTAISVKPDLPDAWNTLGLILLEKKQNDQAAEAFRSALQLKPDFSEAKANLDKASAKSDGPKSK